MLAALRPKGISLESTAEEALKAADDGRLPEFFSNEDELRAIWSFPDTRRQLLRGLDKRGFGAEQLAEMQRIIDAEKSDIFDVLGTSIRHWPWPPTTRLRGASWTK